MQYLVTVEALPDEPAIVSSQKARDGLAWLHNRIDEGTFTTAYAYPRTGGLVVVDVGDRADLRDADRALAALWVDYPLLATITMRCEALEPGPVTLGPRESARLGGGRRPGPTGAAGPLRASRIYLLFLESAAGARGVEEATRAWLQEASPTATIETSGRFRSGTGAFLIIRTAATNSALSPGRYVVGEAGTVVVEELIPLAAGFDVLQQRIGAVSGSGGSGNGDSEDVASGKIASGAVEVQVPEPRRPPVRHRVTVGTRLPAGSVGRR